MVSAQILRAARNFAISSKKSLCELKKKLRRGAKLSTGRPRSMRPVDIFDAVAQGERELLNGGGSGLANVIAADGDRIEARHALGGVFDDVGHQAHGRARRVDVFLLRDVLLENVVLQRARHARPIDALLLADGEIHGPDDGRGRVDGHRDGHIAERDVAEEDLHVLERADGDAALADFAFGGRVIGIVTHERGQVEGDRESGLALAQ